MKIFSRAGDKVSLALRGRNFLVEGADRRAPRIEDHEQWMAFYGSPPSLADMAAAIERFRQRPLISVLVCLETLETPRVRRLLASLQGVLRTLGTVFRGSGRFTTSVERELHQLVGIEPRVRTITSSDLEPTCADALHAASGEFIGVLDADDELAPEALFELVKRLNEGEADIMYSDEDWLSETGRARIPCSNRTGDRISCSR